MQPVPDLLQQALQQHQSGHLADAERLYQEILQQHPQNPQVLYLLGVLAHQQNQLERATTYYQQAVQHQPHLVDAQVNLGLVLQQQGNHPAAIPHYQKALALQPGNPGVQVNLGIAFYQQGKPELALARYRKALQLNPDFVDAHRNLAHALREQGDLKTAIAHYQTVVQLQPQNPEAYLELGDGLQDDRQFEAAIAVYDRGLHQMPDHLRLQGSRIRARLMAGDLLGGFAEYDDWRLYRAASQPRQFSQPGWDGSELAGQPILLYSEPGAGFGDTLQFIRYAPLVAQRGGRVIVECQAPLVRLLEGMEGITTVVAAGNPLPPFECQAALLSLPRLFGSTLGTLPAQVPYLTVPNSALRLPADDRRKVGLVWGGDPHHLHNQERSCPLAGFQAFLGLEGIAYYSLQKGPQVSELAAFPEIVDLSPQLQDFGDTAAAIAQLDLVMTVDTAVAHLSGALGRPTWVLMSFRSDWRWLADREDSPWYPTVRLFRQQRPGDWRGVGDRLRQALVESGDRAGGIDS